MSADPSDGQKYGKDAGYSEDYGMQETALQPTQDAPPPYDYDANGSGNNGTAAAATASAPMNPFTQKQYQQSSTNPFAR